MELDLEKFEAPIVDGVDLTYIEGYLSYAISKQGQIYSFSKKEFITPSENKNGFLTVVLSKNAKRKWFYVHYLVAITFIKNPNNHGYVTHLDGNRKNNCVDNLTLFAL